MVVVDDGNKVEEKSVVEEDKDDDKDEDKDEPVDDQDSNTKDTQTEDIEDDFLSGISEK